MCYFFTDSCDSNLEGLVHWELKQVRRIGFFVENYNWYIYTYIWLRFMANVGKHTSPMDGMGYRILMLAINLLLHP